MGRFVKGDVVVLPFPFSDLTTSKRRPAVVVASLSGDDILACQITSKTLQLRIAGAMSKDVTHSAPGLLQITPTHRWLDPLQSQRASNVAYNPLLFEINHAASIKLLLARWLLAIRRWQIHLVAE